MCKNPRVFAIFANPSRRKTLKTRCFSLVFLKIWSKIGKNLVFSASFCKGDFQKSQKTSSFYAFCKDARPKCAKTRVFLQFLQINFGKRRWKPDVFSTFWQDCFAKSSTNTMILHAYMKTQGVKMKGQEDPKGQNERKWTVNESPKDQNEGWEGKNERKWRPKRPK